MGLLGKKLTAKHPNRRQEGACFALLVLSSLNLLNFTDRYVPSSVKTLLQEDLKLSDMETSLPMTGMVAVYIVSALFFGWLVDKNVMDRRILLSSAVVFWSMATALAGMSRDIVDLVAYRSLVGVGEAAYMAVAPPLISDYFPPAERNMAFTVFCVCMPLGGAIGYGVGAFLGNVYGWRVAFYACGAPGLLVAFLLLAINDPVRGVNDFPPDAEEDSSQGEDLQQASSSKGSMLQDFLAILSNRAWLLASMGMVAQSFAIGGLADWYQTLLTRKTSLTTSEAGIVLGAATAIGGIGGSLLGAKVAEHVERRVKSSFFLVPALFTIPGAFFAIVAINLTQYKFLAIGSLILGEVCLFTYTSPLQTVSVSVIPVPLRSRSGGLQIFFIHVLGDVISPPIIGRVSDVMGSLELAMQICWVMILVCGFWWWAGYRFLPPLPVSEKKGDEAEVTIASLFRRSAEEASDDESTQSTGSGSVTESGTESDEEKLS